MRDQLKKIQVVLALAAIATGALAGVLPHGHESSESHEHSCALCILGQHSEGDRADAPSAGPALAESGRTGIFDAVVPGGPLAPRTEARGPPLC